VTLSVCVFCGARYGAREDHRAAAEALGRGIAARGWRLVYGGGDVGLMGVVSDAALKAGGEVLGIIPRLLLEREIGKREVDHLVVTETMSDRKERMIAASDAFVALPGGLGTLDELLEVMTLRQLGFIEKPIVLVDVEGYWRPFMTMFERIVAEAFAEQDASSLLTVADGAERALELVAEEASSTVARTP
jgi:uncharacterized protein (TIGR00730 family)